VNEVRDFVRISGQASEMVAVKPAVLESEGLDQLSFGCLVSRDGQPHCLDNFTGISSARVLPISGWASAATVVLLSTPTRGFQEISGNQEWQEAKFQYRGRSQSSEQFLCKIVYCIPTQSDLYLLCMLRGSPFLGIQARSVERKFGLVGGPGT
jgi:hypothetical protein